MKIKFEAEVTNKHVLQQFLQHIRDFDVAHFEDVEISLWIDAPEMPTKEAEAIMQSIEPPFPFMKTFKKQ